MAFHQVLCGQHIELSHRPELTLAFVSPTGIESGISCAQDGARLVGG